jgi:hypothetical protein
MTQNPLFLILLKGFVFSLGIKLSMFSFTHLITASSPLMSRAQVIGGWAISTAPCFVSQVYSMPAFAPTGAPGGLVKY